MKRIEYRVSPGAFAKLREALLQLEIVGFHPDECVRLACAAIGLRPEPYTENALVVDHTLSGDVYWGDVN